MSLTLKCLKLRPLLLRNIIHRTIQHDFKRNLSSSSSSDPFQELRNKPPAQVPPGPLGQPHYETHPHLLSKGQVNPGIFKEEFVLRRHRLAQSIRETMIPSNVPGKQPEMNPPNNHLILIPSTSRSFMIDKIPYFFRQDTDFRYLSGVLEPDCALIIEVTPKKERSIIFVREPNTREEKWEGPRTRPDQNTADFFGVDQALSVDQLDPFLKRFRDKNNRFLLWYDYMNPKSSSIHRVAMDFIRTMPSHQNIRSPKSLIHHQRVVKTPAEIALCRETCRIASESIKETMRLTKNNLDTESQIHATVDYHCRMKGAQFLGYPPVVASGNNANYIHYSNCNQILKEDELILMDAGCELHGYTSDITRTWPKSGKFGKYNKIIYEIVLDVQNRLLDELNQSDPPSVDDMYVKMQKFLGQNLASEKILSESLSTSELFSKASSLCPHHVGHYLGMDVHDTNLVSRSAKLQKGMIITMEPGLYLPYDRDDIPKEFRGIGVRIEDDILITDNGYENLTKICPKTINEIELLCNN